MNCRGSFPEKGKPTAKGVKLEIPWRRWLLCLGLALGGVLLVAAPSGAGILDASWTAPTTNSDGTPLTDLASYSVYYGTADPPCPGSSFFQVASSTPSPSANQTVTFRLTGLSTGTLYYVAVTAVNTSGSESACSTSASAVAHNDFAVSPTGTLDFGSVNLGSFLDQTFTVQNTRGGTVSGTASTSAPFSIVSGSPFSLVGLGATQVVTVRFTPTTSATAMANVNFTADGDTISRIVTGSATDTTPPTVSLTAPTAGTTVSGTVTVTATATDNVGVVGVQFKVDGANLGAELTTAPYAVSWTTTTASNGTHTLTAVARDAAGNTATAAGVSVTVANDTTPPTSSATPSPPPNANGWNNTSVTVTLAATDNPGGSGVQSITYTLTGAQTGSAVVLGNTASFTISAEGTTTVTFHATDNAGNVEGTKTLTVMIDKTPPTVSMTAPAAGSTVAGTVTISASATDNVGVVGVQFTLDGTNLGAEVTAAPYAVSWITTLTLNGTHTLTAVARDAVGNSTTSAGAIVTVSNSVPDTAPPAVSISAPTSGATVAGTITVSATATDNVGVAGVQFNLDGANLGAEVTVAPYVISWDTTTALNGAHTLTAVARDAAGNMATATAVTVTVSNAVAPPSANLVAAYSYDEGAGTTAADATVNKNPATLSGASWSTLGKFGNALSFDGVSSYVESPDQDQLSPGADATFSAWVSLNSAPSEIASVFNKWSQTVDDEYLFGVNPNQMLFFAWQTTGGGAYGTGSYNGASGTGQVPLNAWTHIAVVRSGATLNFYINGSLDASVNAMDTNAFRNGINTLRIGGQGRGVDNRCFNGLIDEVRLYNRALSQAEIQSDMNTPIGSPADMTAPTVSITAPSQ